MEQQMQAGGITVETIKEKKATLRNEILDAMYKFKVETGVIPNVYIDVRCLDDFAAGPGSKFQGFNVKIDVKI